MEPLRQPTNTCAASARFAAYAELGKLRLSGLAVFAVIAGLCLGADLLPSWWLSISTLLGTVLVAVGGSALNMFIERDTDPMMVRTETRPLPSGRLSPNEVLLFGVTTAIVGLSILATMTNLLATALCAAIFFTYVMVYTPMKRWTTLNTLVGAVPGALPPVVGYAAGAGHLDARAIVLFFILFFWQIPHFLAIAWRYREQYQRAGLQMLPVVDREGRTTAVQMVVYCVSLVAVSVLPSSPVLGMTGPLYLFFALLLGLVFLTATVFAAVLRNLASMRACFIVSIIYLPLLFVVMVVDKILTAQPV
jgi:protoheme IX farnesyltransferase